MTHAMRISRESVEGLETSAALKAYKNPGSMGGKTFEVRLRSGHRRKITVTSGLWKFALTVRCFWILELIFSTHRKENFQIWTLTVENDLGTINMRETKDGPELFSQTLFHPEIPKGTWIFFVKGGALLLPCELELLENS